MAGNDIMRNACALVKPIFSAAFYIIFLQQQIYYRPNFKRNDVPGGEMRTQRSVAWRMAVSVLPAV
jgi:hypothetical protein